MAQTIASAKTPARFKLLIHIVVFLLLIILLAKTWAWNKVEVNELYIYGVIVTVGVLMNFFFAFFVYKDPYYVARAAFNNKVPRVRPKVSIMVAVRNEVDVITRCIDSLIAQTYLKKEIIIVNDASTDDTREILDHEYGNLRGVRIIHLENNLGKKKALACAMGVAKGEIYAFTDSDSVLARDAVSRTVLILEHDKNVGAVSGHCRALNATQNILTKIQDSWYEGQFSVRKAFESVFGAVTCVSGPLAVFRKSAIFNYIPAWEADTFLGKEFKFATDRTLTGFVLGGRTIGQRMKDKYPDSPFVSEIDYPARDWKILYCKSARVWTVVPDTLKRVFKQQVRWKKSFIRNLFFTGTFYWRKALLPALVYYAHVMFVFVGPFVVARHIIFLPIQGNIETAVFYVAGILFVGFAFGLDYKIENPTCHRWMYRPIMSLFSTFVLSWLIFYSMVTIKNSIWSRN